MSEHLEMTYEQRMRDPQYYAHVCAVSKAKDEIEVLKERLLEAEENYDHLCAAGPEPRPVRYKFVALDNIYTKYTEPMFARRGDILLEVWGDEELLENNEGRQHYCNINDVFLLTIYNEYIVLEYEEGFAVYGVWTHDNGINLKDNVDDFDTKSEAQAFCDFLNDALNRSKGELAGNLPERKP